MHADFELGDDGEVNDLAGFRRGFHKPLGGRPPGYSPKKAREETARQEAREAAAGDEAEDDDDSDDTDLSTSVKLSRAKARKETALAGMNELNLKIKRGEYLPRAAYQESTATLLSMLSQGLRSLPDTLEHEFGLSPEVLVRIEKTIDDSLSEIAETLALFTEKRG